MELHCIAARSGVLLSFLRTELRLSSTLVKRLKTTGAFRINDQVARTDQPVRPGDRITAVLEEALPDYPAEDGQLSILFEDDCLLAVDKPPGLWVHPSPSRFTGTLANQVAGYFARTGQTCGVHMVTRLDRDTFGVVLLAKHAHIHALLGQMQRQGMLQKTYLASVWGTMPERCGRIDLPIARRSTESLLREVRPDGQEARSDYRVLAQAEGISLLELHPRTGRTHQLRVHCAAMGCPILGDRDYGTAASAALSRLLEAKTQQLCAVNLAFPHPLTGRAVEIRSRQRPIFPDCEKFFPESG